jgi:hypothetical protein
MRGNGSSCSRAKRTEVPVAVPRTQVRAKVELSGKEHQPQQKGGDSDFVAGAKHAYSHCRPKISPLVHQQNEPVPRRARPFSPNQTSRFLRIPGYTSRSREQRQSASVKSLHAVRPCESFICAPQMSSLPLTLAGPHPPGRPPRVWRKTIAPHWCRRPLAPLEPRPAAHRTGSARSSALSGIR